MKGTLKMHFINRHYLLMLPMLIVSLLLALSCSDDDNGGEGGGDGPNQTGSAGNGNANGELAIVAEDNLFNKEELTAPANTEVSLEFDNQDAGVLHNVSVYRSSDAQEVIFRGELFPGVETRTYNFETPESGEYFFRCDVHPDTMTGTFIAR